MQGTTLKILWFLFLQQPIYLQNHEILHHAKISCIACWYCIGIWSKCQVSGDSEVPLPTGYGTFLRVDEFKAILFGGATREGRRNDTYYLVMPKHLSDPWVRLLLNLL